MLTDTPKGRKLQPPPEEPLSIPPAVVRATAIPSGHARRIPPLSWLLERHIAYVLILPTLLGILLINIYPLFYTLFISFHDAGIASPEWEFIGLSNYREIVADPEVWHALRITGIFAVGTVGLSLVIGLVLALLLNRPMRGRGLMRSLFVIPWAVPGFVAALTWAWIFNDQFGILSGLLRQVGLTPPIWLNQDYALWSLIVVMVWKAFPFQMVILLAGLQAIPQELYDAASVDGASTWRQFRSITVPLLQPVAMVSILLAAINAFHFFVIPWILTRGGPSKATNVISIETYNIAFQGGNFGYGAAAAMLMFLFVLGFSALYLPYFVRREG